jgi:hypothetical protein
MKKYIFTESQVKKIIDSQINEQTTEERILINNGSEEFLSMKKIQGKDLTEKIKKYQMSIGCPTTGHMLDSIDCIKQKNKKDFILLRDSMRRNRSIFDKIPIAFAKLFGYKEDPESIF